MSTREPESTMRELLQWDCLIAEARTQADTQSAEHISDAVLRPVPPSAAKIGLKTRDFSELTQN